MNSELLKNFVKKARRRLIGRENTPSAKIRIISNDDQNLKDKIIFLLEQKNIVTNPAQYLIDDKKFKNMDEEQRERYLLSTLDKYALLKGQIENVKQYDSRCM